MRERWVPLVCGLPPVYLRTQPVGSPRFQFDFGFMSIFVNAWVFFLYLIKQGKAAKIRPNPTGGGEPDI